MNTTLLDLVEDRRKDIYDMLVDTVEYPIFKEVLACFDIIAHHLFQANSVTLALEDIMQKEYHDIYQDIIRPKKFEPVLTEKMQKYYAYSGYKFVDEEDKYEE